MSRSCALVPYVTAGFPTGRECRRLLAACVRAGGDAVELGIPFSDPLADGPVIQRASQRALAEGMTVRRALGIARDFRGAPLYVMTYANPVLSFGLARFADACASAGVRGVIVADLTPEESAPFRRAGLPLVFLCAPTTTRERIARIGRATGDFLYLVSVRGVTGVRAGLPPDLPAFVRRVRRETAKPLYVGFGISTPTQARAVARIADGVIVGSALLREVERGGVAAGGRFVARLRRAMDQ